MSRIGQPDPRTFQITKWGWSTAQGSPTAQIRRHDFALMPSIPGAMLGDVIKIRLDLQLVEPEASGD